DVEAWSQTAGQAGRPLPAFVQFDTGMSRLGLEPSEQATLAGDTERLNGIDILGWMTHLACADDPDHPLNVLQRDRLKAATHGLPPAPRSLCNSAGIFLGPDFHFDIARPGSALYGISPVKNGDNPMRQPVRLTSPILQVRTIPKGAIVGYGATHTATRPSRIATIPVGYADGILRSLSNHGAMWLEGHAVPVAGRVSMDLITLDVTDVPESLAQPGQMVEVIGPHMTPDAIAERAGTIGYEVLTALGHRYDRHYHGQTA
ncbi:MAG: alanine racemase, partial [Pseudomonadota bacterium]